MFGYTIDFRQVKAVWNLIDAGHIPKFLVIDDAAEVVPQLQRTLNGEFGYSSIPEFALLTDILARLPDSTALVITFPSIDAVNDGSNRKSRVGFFGDGSPVTVPSVLSPEEFERLLFSSIRSQLGEEKEDAARRNNLSDVLASYVGLYENGISTLLLRTVLDSSNLGRLVHADSQGQVAEIIEEDKVVGSFASYVSNDVLLSILDIRTALAAFHADPIPEEMKARIEHLKQHGILMDEKFTGFDTLTYKAFLRCKDLRL